jgi:hypothetical protein
MITAQNVRTAGSWGEEPLYQGQLSGHPTKQDGLWYFTLKEEKGKKYLRHRTLLGEIQHLEVEVR